MQAQHFLHLFHIKTLPTVQGVEFLHLPVQPLFVNHQQEVFSYINCSLSVRKINIPVKRKSLALMDLMLWNCTWISHAFFIPYLSFFHDVRSCMPWAWLWHFKVSIMWYMCLILICWLDKLFLLIDWTRCEILMAKGKGRQGQWQKVERNKNNKTNQSSNKDKSQYGQQPTDLHTVCFFNIGSAKVDVSSRWLTSAEVWTWPSEWEPGRTISTFHA